jgi:hypothetical protein
MRLAHFAAQVRGIDVPPQITRVHPVAPEELTDTDEQVAAALLVCATSAINSREQQRWYEKALSISEAAPRCYFEPYFLRSLVARVDALNGRTVQAFASLCESVEMAIRANAPPQHVADLVLRASNLGYAIGQWADVEALAPPTRRRPDGSCASHLSGSMTATLPM